MKKIKSIVFDLDNTLYDADTLTEETLKHAVESMIAEGLVTTIPEGFTKIQEIIRHDARKDKFRELAKFFGQEDERIIRAGHETYMNAPFETLKIFPDTKKVLNALKKDFKLVLLSQGSPRQQERKIDVLGIRVYFDLLLFPQMGEKKKYFERLSKQLEVKPEEILVVGDRIDNELKIAKSMGMKTVRLVHGKYASLQPQEKDERPDFEIKNLSELITLLKS
ncbi:MAG: hypothetical protein RL557_661 [archaeon]|jgi:putative hydrolase of the HAD superfamily